MNAVSTPAVLHQSTSAAALNFGPLSQRTKVGAVHSDTYRGLIASDSPGMIGVNPPFPTVKRLPFRTNSHGLTWLAFSESTAGPIGLWTL